MGASGLRSSCASMARNSSLRRSTSCSASATCFCATSWRCSSSARFRSVITSVNMMTPPISPRASCHGRTSQRSQSVDPSALTNESSSWVSTAPARQRRWISFQRSGISGKHVVVAAADQVLIAQLVVGQPARAVDEVPHVAVEHRHRRGRVLHEQAHLVVALLDRLLGAFAFGDVATDRLVFDDAAALVEETAVGPLVPAHLPAGPRHLVLDRRHRMIGRDRREKRPGRRVLLTPG